MRSLIFFKEESLLSKKLYLALCKAVSERKQAELLWTTWLFPQKNTKYYLEYNSGSLFLIPGFVWKIRSLFGISQADI